MRLILRITHSKAFSAAVVRAVCDLQSALDTLYNIYTYVCKHFPNKNNFTGCL